MHIDFINYLGGSIVVNYPYDNNAASVPTNTPSNDDDVFRSLAKTYSFNHPTMRKDPCGEGFKDGITNGGKKHILKIPSSNMDKINTIF